MSGLHGITQGFKACDLQGDVVQTLLNRNRRGIKLSRERESAGGPSVTLKDGSGTAESSVERERERRGETLDLGRQQAKK